MGSLMTPDTIYRKNPDVVARGLAEKEGGVFLRLDSGAYFGVNQVGLLVWELIDGQRTVTELVEAVRTRVTDPPPQLQADIGAFLDRAAERNLVLPADQDGPG
jgi:hypothetical protein